MNIKRFDADSTITSVEGIQVRQMFVMHRRVVPAKRLCEQKSTKYEGNK